MSRITIATTAYFVMPQPVRVPFLDVGAAYIELKPSIDDAIHRVLDSHMYVLGPEVQNFESEFADYVSANHCVGVANGLEALRLALRAVGVNEGDEVIVPSHTFIATWLAVTQCGAQIVPIEPESNGFNIDPVLIEAAITDRTKAIVVVHLYGQPAQLAEILEIGTKYQIPVVEDAAQAHGSLYNGRKIGSHSDAVAWSFYPSKNLGAFGDAGAVTTNRIDVADQIRIEANYGSRAKYEHTVIGTNSRLDPIQAAILRVKLRVLDEWNSRRENLARIYSEKLNSKSIVLPSWEINRKSAWHLYVVQVNDRDEIRAQLDRVGIETGIHYPVSIQSQLSYEGQYGQMSLERTAELSRTVMSLPMGPHLTEAMVDSVIDVLGDLLADKPTFVKVKQE
jgi:dTDP-4-amino-4,6-dideoxygalactose transaminase